MRETSESLEPEAPSLEDELLRAIRGQARIYFVSRSQGYGFSSFELDEPEPQEDDATYTLLTAEEASTVLRDMTSHKIGRGYLDSLPTDKDIDSPVSNLP